MTALEQELGRPVVLRRWWPRVVEELAPAEEIRAQVDARASSGGLGLDALDWPDGEYWPGPGEPYPCESCKADPRACGCSKKVQEST